MNLTKLACDKARYQGDGKSRDVRWDGTVRGFGLRIFPSGVKSFVLSFRVGGRKRLLTLGAFGVLTVDQARDRARRELAKVLDGKDPLETRREARATGLTFKVFSEEYLERHAKAKKRSWSEDKRRIDNVLLPAWGTRTLKSIQASDVAALHSKHGKAAPYEANRTLSLLHKMFDLAATWRYLDGGAANPCRGVEAFDEQSRDRWVLPNELPRLLEAIRAESNVYLRSFFILALLTGCRRSELLGAKWTDVDLSRGELRIPKTKAGRIHHVALSREACSVLHALPREQDNPYVFPGHVKGEHLVAVDKPWHAIRKAAGLEDVRIHDLRRTAGSYLAMSGSSLPVIGKVLNHSNPNTTKIYARLAEDVGRKPLEHHGAVIAGLAGKNAAALGLVPAEETKPAKAKA